MAALKSDEVVTCFEFRFVSRAVPCTRSMLSVSPRRERDGGRGKKFVFVLMAGRQKKREGKKVKYYLHNLTFISNPK